MFKNTIFWLYSFFCYSLYINLTVTLTRHLGIVCSQNIYKYRFEYKKYLIIFFLKTSIIGRHQSSAVAAYLKLGYPIQICSFIVTAMRQSWELTCCS